MTTTKKLLSYLLMLTMLFSMVPSSIVAHAASGETVNSVEHQETTETKETESTTSENSDSGKDTTEQAETSETSSEEPAVPSETPTPTESPVPSEEPGSMESPAVSATPAETPEASVETPATPSDVPTDPVKNTEQPSENKETVFVVRFETNGGSDVEVQWVESGMAAEEPETPVKEGFIFDSWYEDATFAVAFDFETPVTADLTLYARWTESEALKPAFSDAKTVNGVKITVTAPEGVFPEGATLSVASVPVYAQQMVNEAVEGERSADANVVVSYTFDIKVLDAEGNEIQPDDEQSVKVSFALAEAANQNLDVQVYHISDDGDAQALDTNTSGQTVEAETTGFSYYTVEFTYSTMTYVLAGDEEVNLSVILNAVGLTGEVTAARSSNDALLSVSKESGEWVIISHQPFTSEETLVVTINGINYEIIVTDEISGNTISGTVNASDLPDNAAITLTGDTTIIIDANKTIKSISGDYALTIQSNEIKQLEINSGGHGISVSSFTMTGGVVAIDSKKDGLNIDKDIIINRGLLYIDAGKDGIYSRNGNITINDGNVESHSGTNCAAINAKSGNVIINGGTVTARGAKYGIYAGDGAITLNGTITATAAGWAIWAKNGLEIKGGKTIARGMASIWIGGTITIEADVEAKATLAGAPAISGAQGVTINGGTIIAECTTDGIAIQSSRGDININAGTVTANGAKYGIYAGDGAITLNGTVTATAGGWAIWAKNNVIVNGGTLDASAMFAIVTESRAITIKSPLAIETPSGGKVSGKTIVDTSNNIAKHVIIKPVPIVGSAEILGTETRVGDTLQLKTTDVPSPYQIQWQKRYTSSDEWEDVPGGSGNTYKTKPGDVSWCFRAKVTATGYGGEIYSNERWILTLPTLTGQILYTSGVHAGVKVTTGITDILNTLYTTTPEKVHFQWQISNNGTSGWTDITGATSTIYTPTGSDVGKYIRLTAFADGYQRTIMSKAREVVKQSNDGDPVAPGLSVASPYTEVTVINAKADQEYVVSYSLGSPDWTGAIYPGSDGTLNLTAEKDRSVYVYTRMRGTDTKETGTKIVYNKIYNGYTTYLADFVLDKTTVVTKVGEVTALTVSPLPSDFSGWNNSYTVSWYVNGSGVELFTNSACTIPVTQHSPIYNKTVYVKGTAQTSYVEVGVERQIGPTDIRNARCSFEVADSEGNRALRYLQFEDVAMAPGETVTTEYVTVPTPALVGTLSFEKSSGPDSALTLATGSGSTVNITAPSDAALGVYYYKVKVDGSDTTVISSIKITVLSSTATVTIDANNGSGAKRTETVEIGSEFILPELPSEFAKPTDSDFDGYDKGAVGESFIVDGDTTVKVRWIPHVHSLTLIPGLEATCTADGNKVYYRCETCGKLFSDAAGTIEAPTADYFTIPATGHTAGTAVRENETTATCTEAGGYDEVIYCTVCDHEISRTHTDIPATGHTLTHVPEKEATCTEDGNHAYYECDTCGRWFEDATGAVEITDYHDVIIDALGHDWGAWVQTKAPTATEEGEETRTCSRCAETETRSIPKLGVTSYEIIVNVGAHGSAYASAGASEEGKTITVSATPDSGYEIDKITYTPEGGTETDITSAKSFTMPAAKVTVNVSFKASSVTPVTVSGISIATPGKTAYTVGEALDVTGLTIKVDKSDGTSETVPVTAAMVSGFDSSAPATSQTLTITYEGKTTTYDVSISAGTPVTYTVTVNAGANGTASASATSATAGTNVTVTATPNSGYEIDKITYTPDGGSETDITSAKSFTMPAANVTVNVSFKASSVTPPAPTTYTVTFETNGGSAVSAQTVNSGDKATKPADPTRSGYTFAGWYADATFSAAFDFNTPITKNVTVYAKWTQNGSDPAPVTKYTITYDLNGGTLDGKTGIVTVQVEDGATITLPAPTRSGYTFDYWEGSKYNAGDSYKVTGDHTFTAQWKADSTGGNNTGTNTGTDGKTVVNAPKTGDDSNIALWLVLMVVSLLGFVFTLVSSRRSKAGRYNR